MHGRPELLYLISSCALANILSLTGARAITAPHGERDTGHQVAFFIYRRADGRPYLGVKKTSTKQFPQFHAENGRWVKGPPQGPRIPYRLPELVRAPLNVWTVIAAGEKDVAMALAAALPGKLEKVIDALGLTAALGFIATTNPEGERKGAWAPELNAWFQGRRVAIMEDHDATGEAHVIEVAEALRGIAADIRIITSCGQSRSGLVASPAGPFRGQRRRSAAIAG